MAEMKNCVSDFSKYANLVCTDDDGTCSNDKVPTERLIKLTEALNNISAEKLKVGKKRKVKKNRKKRRKELRSIIKNFQKFEFK